MAKKTSNKWTAVLGDSPRTKVLGAFLEEPNTELSAAAIQETTGAVPATIYNQIKALVSAGILVEAGRENKTMFYKLEKASKNKVVHGLKYTYNQIVKK